MIIVNGLNELTILYKKLDKIKALLQTAPNNIALFNILQYSKISVHRPKHRYFNYIILPMNEWCINKCFFASCFIQGFCKIYPIFPYFAIQQFQTIRMYIKTTFCPAV